MNYLAILVAGIASMVIGFLWYGPVFGKTWMRLMGFTPESIKSMKQSATQSYVIGFIGALITAYVLARLSSGSTIDAFMLAFWPWLGFVVPLSAGGVLWEGKPWKLFFLNIVYYLVSFVVMAFILVGWR